MVEFALAAPLLFAFIFVILEAAFLINAQLTIDNLAREAVRTGALCGQSTSTWTNPNTGKVYSGGPSSNPCDAAIRDTINSNAGILRVNVGTNPTITTVAPAPGSSSSDCQSASASGGYYAGPGCLISVTIAYHFQFFFNFIVGPTSPSITLGSTATQVSQ